MLFRNDYGDYTKEILRGTHIGLARSQDGYRFEVDPDVKYALNDGEIWRIYDPRITYIDGQAIVCCAVDTRHSIRGGIALTEDFKTYTMVSLSAPDNRNMVLFPEKINGEYVRLERPMPVYSRGGDRFDMWISYSKDLVRVNWFLLQRMFRTAMIRSVPVHRRLRRMQGGLSSSTRLTVMIHAAKTDGKTVGKNGM